MPTRARETLTQWCKDHRRLREALAFASVSPKQMNSERHTGHSCIALDDAEPSHRAEIEGALLGSWRDVYPDRPKWWDELELGTPRDARSYRQQVPLGWVTVSKAGKELVTPRTQLHAGLHKM